MASRPHRNGEQIRAALGGTKTRYLEFKRDMADRQSRGISWKEATRLTCVQYGISFYSDGLDEPVNARPVAGDADDDGDGDGGGEEAPKVPPAAKIVTLKAAPKALVGSGAAPVVASAQLREWIVPLEAFAGRQCAPHVAIKWANEMLFVDGVTVENCPGPLAWTQLAIARQDPISFQVQFSKIVANVTKIEHELPKDSGEKLKFLEKFLGDVSKNADSDIPEFLKDGDGEKYELPDGQQ